VTGNHRAVDEAAPSRTPSGPRRGRLRIVTMVAAVLCVPLVAALVVLLLRESDAVAEEDARAEALAAAVTAATDVLSFDYRTLDQDVATAQADTTGLFAREYRQTADALKQQAADVRAIVQATPSRPGVISATADEVVILVFVDQASVRQVAGAKRPTTRIDQSRVRMTMTKVGDRWLVSQLAAL
jgi:Mce-associated membrane protein